MDWPPFKIRMTAVMFKTRIAKAIRSSRVAAPFCLCIFIILPLNQAALVDGYRLRPNAIGEDYITNIFGFAGELFESYVINARNLNIFIILPLNQAALVDGYRLRPNAITVHESGLIE